MSDRFTGLFWEHKCLFNVYLNSEVGISEESDLAAGYQEADIPLRIGMYVHTAYSYFYSSESQSSAKLFLAGTQNWSLTNNVYASCAGGPELLKNSPLA